MAETPTKNELVDELIKNYELMISNLKAEINCYKKMDAIRKLMLETKLDTVVDQELINMLYPWEINNHDLS